MNALKMIRNAALSLLLIGVPLADTAVLVLANDVAPVEYDGDFENEELAILDEIVSETAGEGDSQAPLVQEDSLSDTTEAVAWETFGSQRMIAEGRLADQPGINGISGAPWRLYESGLLEVDSGFINWTNMISPWDAYRDLITDIIFTGPITAGPSLDGLFSYLPYVTTIKGLEQFDTSHVTDMRWMFLNTTALTHLDLSSWDTSHVTDMFAMFVNAQSLTYLNVSSWDTGNVTNMSAMFNNAMSLTRLDLTHWDTSSVTNMSAMFTSASGLTELDLSNWDTSRVTLMASMFTNARGLAHLDVSNWDTSHVTDMRWLFQDASSLTHLDLSSWDTSHANMDWMFTNTNSLSQLTLGQQFSFRGNLQLPAVPNNASFIGHWQNVGNGTRENPMGEFVFTSAELTEQFNGSTMADTFVWQPVTFQQAVTGIELVRDELTVAHHGTSTIQFNILPANATNQAVTFESADENIATVNAAGLVTGVNVGTTTVTLRTVEGGYEATITITVLPIILATNVTVTPIFARLLEGETLRLTATIQPGDATDQRVSWSSNNPGVATVDENGLVTAVQRGVTIVTATVGSGSTALTATSMIIVQAPVINVTGVTLTGPSTLDVFGTGHLVATVLPNDATNQQVTWSSSNPAVATVNFNGFVTAVGAGTVTLTATTADGGHVATHELTVRAPVRVTGISIPLIMVVNRSAMPTQFPATVLPANATTRSVIWTSSNPAMLDFDSNGAPISTGFDGTVMVTARTVSGNFTATMMVIILP